MRTIFWELVAGVTGVLVVATGIGAILGALDGDEHRFAQVIERLRVSPNFQLGDDARPVAQFEQLAIPLGTGEEIHARNFLRADGRRGDALAADLGHDVHAAQGFVESFLPSLVVVETARAERVIYAADHNNGKVVKFKEDGTPLWDFPNRNAHDVQLLPNGNVLINPSGVQEVTADKKIVWEIGPPAVGKAESCQRLPNGDTMIADNKTHTIYDVSPEKKIVWSYDVPDGAGMRQVRRLANGNTLICASTKHVVLEVDREKRIVWRYELPFPYLAVRLENGNTLISCGTQKRVIEVTPDKKIVWEFTAKDAPEVNLTWASSIQQLPNGNLLIGNFIRNQEGKGAHAFEVTREKKIVWKWADHSFIKSLTTVRIVD